MTTTPIVFLDIESDGLHPDRQAWEVAMVRRDEKGQHETQFFVDIDLQAADPFGLKVGGFYERHPYGMYLSGRIPDFSFGFKDDGEFLRPRDAAHEVARWTHGATIVGAVPNFDTETLAGLLRANKLIPAWSHRLRCVEAITAGHLGREVGGLSACAEALGIEHIDKHTAMGDVRAAMAIYDRIIKADNNV